MKEFMGKEFLLESPLASHLYHDYAENMPIVDYHCHISPEEIYKDRKFENITQVWLGGHIKNKDGSDSYFGDHYKWRLMRANGVSEEYITGDKADKERFFKFCETLEKTIGNPMNHWCQLELKKYFDIDLPICLKNAEEIWNIANDKLQNDPNCTVRGLINSSNVEFVGTTDDPIDSLEWHKLIKEDPTIKVKICPSFRPDKALKIEESGFKQYINKLSEVSGVQIIDADSCLKALENRLDYFVSLGCKASDHGLSAIVYTNSTNKEASIAFNKAMNNQSITDQEKNDWVSYLLTNLGEMYYDKDVVMQYHYNVIRNTNKLMFNKVGVDTGFDAMDGINCISGIENQLSKMTEDGKCPKTILYSLNPSDMDMVAVIANCFQQDSDVPSRIQLGAAWWFNDTRDGMVRHLQTLGRLGVLGNFVGMLTDSRSFLSYTRHDYFRRILCNTIANWVNNGEFPNNDELLKPIIEGISYYNAKKYFSL